MKPLEFAHFLKGIIAVSSGEGFNKDTTTIVKDALNSIFEHVVPEAPVAPPVKIIKEGEDPKIPISPLPAGWTPEWTLGTYGWQPPGVTYRC